MDTRQVKNREMLYNVIKNKKLIESHSSVENFNKDNKKTNLNLNTTIHFAERNMSPVEFNNNTYDNKYNSPHMAGSGSIINHHCFSSRSNGPEFFVMQDGTMVNRVEGSGHILGGNGNSYEE